ncbi:hypothetical protein [Apibacter sp. HY039]|uniref:hypothetical protein n=1 Tax=Apibacter sp. HY039 TaxID=2501476 RepID=UPI000FEBAAA6|nr:hypothetical protein [Apibacter sp. HY039]
MNKVLIILLIPLIFMSCIQVEQRKNIKKTEEYYKVFSEGKNIEQFLDFYSDSDPIWNDAVSQSSYKNKENIKNKCLSIWNDKKYEGSKTVSINQMLANDSIVVVSGHYNSYYYNNSKYDKVQFTAWLYFDKKNKIKKQVEWIQYPFEDLQSIIIFNQNTQIQ